MPLSLLSGAFLPDLIVSVLSITFIIYSLIEKEWKYFKNTFFYLFIMFYIYLLINSLLSHDRINSLESSLFYFRFGIFSLAVWFLIDNNKHFLKYSSIIFLITFLIAVIDGYYQFYHDVNLLGIHYPGVRMTLLFNDKLVMGSYIARLFPLIIALFLLQATIYKFNKYLFTLLFGVMLISTDVLVYISGERTAFGLLFLFTIYIIIFISKFRTLRIITFLISILFIVLLTIYNSDVRDRNIEQTFEQITENNTKNEFSESKLNLFSSQHESHYITSWNMFKKNPIFGLGVNSFRIFCENEDYNHDNLSCSTHPHNSYLQILAETGIVGISFILFMLIFLILEIFKIISSDLKNKKRHIEDYQICLIGCFLITLWPLLPTQNFFNNWINVVYYLPVGFYLHAINNIHAYENSNNINENNLRDKY